MNKPNRILQYSLAYSMWVVSLLLWAAFIFISRDAITDLLSIYYYQEKFQRLKAIQFFNQAYPFVLGLVWVVLMLVVEQYFRNGVKKGNLIYRIARVIGPILLLMFAANLAQVFALGISAAPPVYWLILVFEVLVGGWLVWLARKGLKVDGPSKSINLG